MPTLDVYSLRNPTALMHLARLKLICNTIEKFFSQKEITWGEFGCSSGRIIHEVLENTSVRFRQITGFDVVEENLELAKNRKFPNADFRLINLVDEDVEAAQTYTLITCFETLEHVSNTQTAFRHLYNHVEPGGYIIITVPNETGYPGLVRFLGRMVFRRTFYSGFFKSRSRLSYIKRLLLNQEITDFRVPKSGNRGYGTHLGFDYRTLRDHIDQEYVQKDHLEWSGKMLFATGMNAMFVLHRPAENI